MIIAGSEAEAECPLWVTSGHMHAKGMSALPPKADMCSAKRNVRYVPIADMRASLDHFVGALDELYGHIEAKRLGGLKVDHESISSSSEPEDSRLSPLRISA